MQPLHLHVTPLPLLRLTMHLLRTLTVPLPPLLMTLMDHPQPPLMMLMDLLLLLSTPPLLKIMPPLLKDMPPRKMPPHTPPTPSLPLKLTSANSWECSPANTSPFSLLFLSELS